MKFRKICQYETTIKPSVLHLNKITFEPQNEYSPHNTHVEKNTGFDCIRTINNLISRDWRFMNAEERQWSFNIICEQYCSLFHLEKDKLTFTDAVSHTIKLPENQTPIYRRPHRSTRYLMFSKKKFIIKLGKWNKMT